MNIVLGIIIIFFGGLTIRYPESYLGLQDMFRISGKREYTDFAILMTRFGGFAGVALGIILMVFGFEFFN